MTRHVPGMADRMRKHAISRVSIKRYANLDRSGVRSVLNRLDDDTIIIHGPVEIIEALEQSYPRSTDPWERWDRFRNTMDAALTLQVLNEWAHALIEHAHGKISEPEQQRRAS